MKCLIHCPERDIAWVKEYFPGISPYLLNIANKPYLEYLVDYCLLQGVSSIKIATDMPIDDMEAVLGHGERWRIDISYVMVPPEYSTCDVYSRHAKSLSGDDLLIFSGMFWHNYDKRQSDVLKIATGDSACYCKRFCLIGRECNDGGFCKMHCRQATPDELDIQPLSSIRDYFNLSMEMVRGKAVNYSMPNYNDAPQLYIGQNVSISRTCDITAPVHLGSTLQLSEHTQIGPSVIIGDNSFIDEHTQITNSVIMGNSYVGQHLEIIGKIIYRNHIIDPENGIQMDIVDNQVLMPILPRKKQRSSILQRFSALLLWIILLPFFLLLRPWIQIHLELVECFMSADRQKKIWLKLYIQKPRRWTARYFRKLSLDRFHLLPLAIRGELRLVGNRILPVNDRNAKLLQQFPDYAPGLFSYSEMLEHEADPDQSEMDELYYVYHVRSRLNLQILFKTLARNLLKAT